MSRKEVIDWIKCNKGKFIALIIACVYILLSLFSERRYIWIPTIFALALPLACIFYGEAMGNIPRSVYGWHITKSSPGCIVVLVGWLLLLFPLVWGIVLAIIQNKT